MSASDSYITFPLYALSFGSQVYERIEHAISAGLVDAGFSIWRKSTEDQRQKWIAAIEAHANTPSDYKRTKVDITHASALVGFITAGCTTGSIKATLDRHNKMANHVNAQAAKHGASPTIRMPKGMLFEVRDSRGISYREFAVLAAIYSVIGRKKYPVCVTRYQIQRRMLGYKSREQMDAELPIRTDGMQPLTLRQINRTVDKLHQLGFFARVRANARQTFYSHRMDRDEMIEKMVTGRTFSDKFHSDRRQRDAEVMQRIKESRELLK